MTDARLRARTQLRKWGPWAALVVVAAVVLTIGLSRPSHPTLDQRVQHIAGMVRCPICNGESAAVSQSTPAVEIRDQIRQDLQAGQSQGQILDSLVKSYGSGILEKPRTSGIGLVVWVVPVVGFVVGLAGLSFAFVRWRARASETSETSETSGAAGEREGAPAPDRDLATVAVGGDRPASGVTERSTAAPSAPDAADGSSVPPASAPARAPRRRRWSRRRTWVAAAAGTALVATGASWAVVASSGTRLPGQEVTGQTAGAQSEIAAELQKAAQDAVANDAPGAVKEYQKVLQSDPNQTQALTGEGWILAETAQPTLLRQGLAMLAKAEKVDPSYAPAHVYRGIALLSEDDYGDAIPELQWYLAHNPDPQLVPQVQKALQDARTGLAATKP